MLYALQYLPLNIIKIGYSWNPWNRMDCLLQDAQRATGESDATMRLLAVAQGRINDETALHRALAEHAVDGPVVKREWYRPTAAVLHAISGGRWNMATGLVEIRRVITTGRHTTVSTEITPGRFRWVRHTWKPDPEAVQRRVETMRHKRESGRLRPPCICPECGKSIAKTGTEA